MALVKCEECGKDVSSSAKACPGCGHELPTKTSLGALIFAAAVLVAIISAIVATQNASDDAELAEKNRLVAMTPAQRAADTAQKKELSDYHDAQYTCEERIKSSLHDPDSASFDDPSEWSLISAKPRDRYEIRVTLRAKNGFGALRHFAIMCTVSRQNGSSWRSALKELH